MCTIYSKGLNSVLSYYQRTWPSETTWLAWWAYLLLVTHITTLTSVFLISPCPQSPCGEQSCRALLHTAAVAVPTWMFSAVKTSTGRFRLSGVRGKDEYLHVFHHIGLNGRQSWGDRPQVAKGEPALFLQSLPIGWVLPGTKGDLADQKDCVFKLSV